MLFYGHSNHVAFSTQLEAVAAYLAVHFIMIHLIRVIKIIWLRCWCSAYCVTFIHCKRTWKWYLKENEVLTWHITTCPGKLVDCSLYLHSPMHVDRAVSFIFFHWERFWCNVKVYLENSIVNSPETKTSSCSYAVSVCLIGQNGESVST